MFFYTYFAYDFANIRKGNILYRNQIVKKLLKTMLKKLKISALYVQNYVKKVENVKHLTCNSHIFPLYTKKYSI